MHTSPAVVFSAGGYTGNFFHDFNDGLLPLFITVNSFFGNHDFHLVVTDCSLWWPQKYKEVISRISSLPMIDMDRDNRTHCFPSTIVGLIKHGPMTVEPARLARPITLRDFGSFLKDAYLGQGEDKAMQQSNHSQDTGSVRPRLVLLSRTRQVGRAVLNQKELMALAEQIGFNVTLFKPSHKTSLADAFRLIHASHAMLGVHGAGLMHSIFLRPGSVLVQVVPIATEWVSEMFFGNPARTLGLEYIEYRIQPSESSLADQFSIDDVVLNNPRAATKGDWSNMKLYLKTQNVKLDMVRFRACLEEAYVKAKRFMEENEAHGTSNTPWFVWFANIIRIKLASILKNYKWAARGTHPAKRFPPSSLQLLRKPVFPIQNNWETPALSKQKHISTATTAVAAGDHGDQDRISRPHRRTEVCSLSIHMKGARLEFGSPISDAVSRIRFAPRTNNLLISSWDSCLRLYDVEGSALRLEAPSQAALLNCCFQGESVAFSAGSDCAIRRHDMHSGTQEIMGHHDDIATCVEHSDESSILITTGLDKMIIFWDPRLKRALVSKSLQVEVESISLAGFELMLAMGSSAYLYDLRNLDGPLQSKESKVDARIRCISSASSCSGFAVGSVDGRVAVEVSASSTSKNTAVLGAFVTGDNEGYVAAWDFQNRRRLFELPRFPNGVASMSYNKNGDLLAIAASYSYQEADELNSYNTRDKALYLVAKINLISGNQLVLNTKWFPYVSNFRIVSIIVTYSGVAGPRGIGPGEGCGGRAGF
ncbi:hypothetical protein CRG98_035186 [Punica granatum]|uniref:Glycosyltransferase 61 catalytic domain-containing protein n=1 Tax=Punica granatum TaxID=22663 RepID=A0A2I0IKC1_PUNGR|nr:hypothetical protein CRG98_035186 [Punica granatum]